MPVLCQSIHCSNKEIKVYTNHAIMKIPKIIIKQPNHIVIQRMEDVVIVWFDKIQRELIHHNKLHSHNNVQGSINEQYCIWNYCRKILSHIILDGKIQTTTTITNINRPIYDDPEFPYSTLWKKPLPSLQDISCMVVTIRHWYYHLVQHPVQLYQNYPKEILYLYHRFVTNQQQEEQEQQITIETYIRTCETNVRKWIGLSDDEIITSIEPIDQQPKQQQQQRQQHNSNRPLPLDEVGSTNVSTSKVYAMKQPNKFQQQQRTCTYPTNDIVPTNITSSQSISCTPTNENYKKPSARSGVSCTLDNVKNKDKNKSNHNKPVARPDIVDLTVDEESIKQYENRQTKTKNTNKRIKCLRRINKPATQSDVIELTIDEDSTIQCQNCQTTTTVRSNNIAIRNNDSLALNSSNDKINRLRGMILMMYHAEKCPFQNPTLTDNDSSHHTCRIYDGCSVIKQLHQHVVNRLCNDDDNANRNKIVSSNCSSRSKIHKCKYGILCHDAKEAMYHYAHCPSTNLCTICNPVLRQLPNMEQEIQIAVNKLHVSHIENDSCSNKRNKRKSYYTASSRLAKQQKLSNVNATSSSNNNNATVSQSPPIALIPQKRLSTTPITTTTTKVKQRYRSRRHKQISRYTCRII